MSESEKLAEICKLMPKAKVEETLKNLTPKQKEELLKTRTKTK